MILINENGIQSLRDSLGDTLSENWGENSTPDYELANGVIFDHFESSRFQVLLNSETLLIGFLTLIISFILGVSFYYLTHSR